MLGERRRCDGKSQPIDHSDQASITSSVASSRLPRLSTRAFRLNRSSCVPVPGPLGAMGTKQGTTGAADEATPIGRGGYREHLRKALVNLNLRRRLGHWRESWVIVQLLEPFVGDSGACNCVLPPLPHRPDAAQRGTDPPFPISPPAFFSGLSAGPFSFFAISGSFRRWTAKSTSDGARAAEVDKRKLRKAVRR